MHRGRQMDRWTESGLPGKDSLITRGAECVVTLMRPQAAAAGRLACGALSHHDHIIIIIIINNITSRLSRSFKGGAWPGSPALGLIRCCSSREQQVSGSPLRNVIMTFPTRLVGKPPPPGLVFPR